MSAYRKAPQWSDPKNKVFPYQVGFTCPPRDWDAAPTDFLRMSPETVGVHGWMLHDPDYRHGLDQRARNFGMLEDFVHLMANNGADVCGQVGSNWVHASGLGVEGVRQHCEDLSDKYQTRFHMAGYAMVEALRAMNIEKLALNAVYHRPDWWLGTVAFWKEAGFDVLWAGNFVDQGWFASQAECDAQIWCFDGDLAWKSFEYTAEKAPNADAILVNGMCNFRRAEDGLARRPVHLEAELEKRLGKPVIGHDTALYWRIFKTLGVAPVTEQGTLLNSLKG